VFADNYIALPKRHKYKPDKMEELSPSQFHHQTNLVHRYNRAKDIVSIFSVSQICITKKMQKQQLPKIMHHKHGHMLT